MRHGKKINHLGRTSSHRKAMLSNMASSLILHKRISTTLAKAKALRTYVEPLFTRSKDDSTHNRRTVFSYLQNKEAVSELFREISKKISERPGGYTRILKTGNRLGDNADMCIIELVDYNEAMLGAKEGPKAKPTRRRRSTTGKKKTDEGHEPAAEKPARTEAATDTTAESKAKKSVKKATKKSEEPEESKATESPENIETGDEAGEVKE
jgi:large subunit ribosomal protein L17